MLIKNIEKTAKNDASDVVEACLGKKNGYVNPYSYFLSRDMREEYMPDNVFMDGIALVLLSRLLGVKGERFSFDMTSMAPMVFDYALRYDLSVAFIGGRNEEIGAFESVLEKNYAGLKVALTANGFDHSVVDYMSMLRKTKPDFVIIGMGAPLQDEVMYKLHSAYPATYFTCGGFIVQSGKGLDYYPPLFDRLNLRFVYRAYKEPHYRKRLLLYPLACALFVYDFLKLRCSGSH
jgi:N-acetylglucosaminyldiphosphoundecaprenol N-acetyl-beta-D-mannosaminyltransferase